MRSKMYCIYIVNEQNKAYTKGIYGNKDRAIERYKKWLNEYRAEPMHIEYLRYELVEYKLSKDQIMETLYAYDKIGDKRTLRSTTIKEGEIA
jgi:hypothetical protein